MRLGFGCVFLSGGLVFFSSTSPVGFEEGVGFGRER